MKIKITNIKILLFFFILSSFFLLYKLPSFNIFKNSDMAILSHLMKYICENIKIYTFPLWTPNIFLGYPLIAHPPAFALLYPLSLLFFFKIKIAVLLYLLIHLTFAGFFMYLYTKEIINSKLGAIVAGICFILNGYISTRIYAGHLCFIANITWIPLLFYSYEKIAKKEKIFFYIALGAIAMCCQILSSHMQLIYYSNIVIIIYILFLNLIIKKNISGLFFSLISFALGLSLSSVQLLPTFNLSLEATRTIPSLAFSNQYSFSIFRYIIFFFPDFYGNTINPASTWGGILLLEQHYYFGISVMILSFLSIFFWKDKRKIFFILLSIITLIIGLGTKTIFFKTFYYFLPGFSLFRAHGRILIFFIFSMCIFCGYAIKILKSKKIFSLNNIYKHIIVLSSLLLFILLILLSYYSINSKAFIPIAQKIYLFENRNLSLSITQLLDLFNANFLPYINFFIKNIFKNILISILTLLSILFLLKQNKYNKIILSILIIIIIFDLYSFSQKFIITPLPIPNIKKELRKTINKIKNIDKSLYRIFVTDPLCATPILEKNVYLLNWDHIPLVIKSYFEWLKQSQNININNSPSFTSSFYEYNSIWSDITNSKYLISDKPLEISNKWIPINNISNKLYVYKNNKVWSRFWVTFNSQLINNNNTNLNEINKTFKNITYVENKNLVITNNSNISYPKIIINKYSNNQIILTVNMLKQGFLTGSELYFSGWKVYVDNKPNKILKVNYFFRGVFLTKGQHEIKFIYCPFSFILGSILSFISLIIIIFLLIYKKNFNK